MDIDEMRHQNSHDTMKTLAKAVRARMNLLEEENATLKRKLNVYLEENAVMASRIERQSNLLGIGKGEGNV